MLHEDQIKDLLARLEVVKGEMADLKAQLAAINADKEAWFSKKQDLYQRISSTISLIKEKRTERNTYTVEVRALKEERDKLNEQIGQLVREIKALQATVKLPAGSESPTMLRKKLEKLEMRQETEPMSFDKERELMKEIKDLRKKTGSLKQMEGVIGDIESRSKNVETLKEQANKLHRQIQDKAKQSQEHHEKMLDSSKSIDTIKADEEEAYKKFLTFKEAYQTKQTELKAKQQEYNEIKRQLGDNQLETRAAEDKAKSQILEEKGQAVEEKLKKGKKLTTEDILVLQAKK